MVARFWLTISSLINNISIINNLTVRNELCHMNWLWWKSLCLLFLETTSPAFIGIYHCDAWNISDEFMITFMKDKISSGNKNAMILVRKIYETLGNIQKSFHPALNAFTALKRKCVEILGKIKPGGEKRWLWDHIVRIIVLLKRWLLQIKQGFCMASHKSVTKHLIHFDLWGTALIIKNSLTESPGKAVLLVNTYRPSI